MVNIELTNKSNEELVNLIKNGKKEAFDVLLLRFKNVIKNIGSMYYMNGADADDILQEGMIGFFKAVKGYKSDRETSFNTFAVLCIKRQIMTAVKSHNREKHKPLNTYISIDGETNDEYNALIEIMNLENEAANPEQIAIDKEAVENIEREANKVLSKFEQQVFSEYLKGQDYISIAEIYGKSPKTIDNALYRIKKKVEKILKDKL